MFKKVFSCTFSGLNCSIIEVQADIANGMPHFSIVGLGDTSVQESKDRVRSSIKNSGCNFPQTRKTVNLAPAQLRKQGALFDFPIAVSLLYASGQIGDKFLNDSILIGELSLSGELKKISGALLIAKYAKSQGFKRIFLPAENANEAGFAEGIEIYPVKTLSQFLRFCEDKEAIERTKNLSLENIKKSSVKEADENIFSRIVGLEKEKRALMVACAGHHNVLISGLPGCGKTLLARALKDLFADMEEHELIETTQIFSVAGLINQTLPIIFSRPFREVHSTASLTSLIGGGAIHPKPGEISLAHNGALFLDEIAEFPRKTLEALRQPIEDKFIFISRNNFSVKFPCDFMLIATMNPCPCGHRNNKKVACHCTESQIRNYQKRISGPLLDRFDIFLEIDNVELKNIFKSPAQEEENYFLRTILKAKKVQKERFFKEAIKKNCDMTIKEIQKYCFLDSGRKEFLDVAAEKLRLSGRGYFRTLKIARTIADMEESADIKINHLAEALQYRKKV